MNDIQGLGHSNHMPRGLGGGSVDGVQLPPGLRASDISSRLGSITNGQGQTLFDIRDQLTSAVREALADNPGAERRGVVREAIDAALVANGFDPAELDAARTGGQPLGGNAARASALPGLFAGQGAPSLDEALFGDKDDEEGGDDFLQALLGQYRAGINLDIEI